MTQIDGRVPTDRAGRYLVQLCRHLDQMSTMRHGGPMPSVRQVDWSDTTGTIRFAEGTCTLRATDDALTVQIEADDEEALRRLQEGMSRLRVD